MKVIRINLSLAIPFVVVTASMILLVSSDIKAKRYQEKASHHARQERNYTANTQLLLAGAKTNTDAAEAYIAEYAARLKKAEKSLLEIKKDGDANAINKEINFYKTNIQLNNLVKKSAIESQKNCNWNKRIAIYHAGIKLKYERASSWSWFGIEADPLEPQENQ